MAKMTVYVPGDLKGRMDQAEGVNWSPLACKAFEAKLAEIITTKGAKDMQDVVARLKASKARTDDANRIRGREMGVAWASAAAEFADMQRLEAWTEGEHGTGWTWQDWLEKPGRDDEAFDEGHRLAETLLSQDLDRQSGDRFWSRFVQTETDRQAGTFLIGFVEGALEVWEAVKGQL